jgi:hypothetical protein
LTGQCPATEEWTRKLDGEVTANRAAAMDDHASSCKPCSATVDELEQLVGDIAHPVTADGEAVVDRVMRAIDGGAEVTPIRRPMRWLYPVAGALAAAAVLTVFVTTRSSGTSQTDRGTFQARGGGDDATPLQRNVGLVVSAGGIALGEGQTVSAAAKYTAAYNNLMDDEAVYAMVFAVDSARDVHWLYPAFIDPATDPAGIRLERVQVETAFDDGAILDEPATGPMRVFTLFSTSPVHVSLIEELAPETLHVDALRERFGDMRIEQVEVTVAR